MQLVFTLVIIIMIWLLSIDILIWDVKYYGRFLPKFGISENGTVCSLFPRFPCVLVRSPNQKRFFSVFKVCSTSLVHLIARQKSLLFGLFSFGQSFIHHSSSLFLLFDRIMGLPFALQAECPRSTSSIPTSVRAIKVADGSRFVWLLTGQRPYIFHRWLVLFFIFISWPSEPRLICRTAQGSCCVSGTPDPTPTISAQYPTVNRAFISHHTYCAVRSKVVTFVSPRRLQSWCPVGDRNLSTGDQACQWLAVCLVSQVKTSP